MEKPSKSSQGQTSLFQIYLRLRPSISQSTRPQTPKSDSYLTVEPPNTDDQNGAEKWPTRITVQPPNDSRKRAVEKFAFTKVFEEQTNQLDVFEETEMNSLIKGVLGEGRDGLVATLGVSGSGKTHTMFGSKSQRGLTQMSLDILFKSLSSTVRGPDSPTNPVSIHTLAASDPSDAHIFSAKSFIENTYGDPSGRGSRAQTPLTSSRSQTPMVWNPIVPQDSQPASPNPDVPSPRIERQSHLPMPLRRLFNASSPASSARSSRISPRKHLLPSELPFWNSHKTSKQKANDLEHDKDTSGLLNFPRRPFLQRPNALPQLPDVSDHTIPVSADDEHVVIVSMYEVYNDRIFDLLSPASATTGTRQAANTQKDRRRPLLFKPTEGSTDRKVVAGLRKIVCTTYDEALLVLEAGLAERRIAGTGTNSVSSRSHGFFCVEVKKRTQDKRFFEDFWAGNTMTIVDLAGSERARQAKTAGATLAEAGKINESLMYLGQCLQMQGDLQEGNKSLVPFRQCKLTELLLSNSFPSSNNTAPSQHRYPQKALMIVTADPHGDFNATSQILRYSALAREVTVPRIPSVTSTISAAPSQGNKSQHSVNNKSYLYPASAEELETAALEIARISDDYTVLATRLAEEEIARAEAEFRARAAEEKCLTIEQEVREECWEDMEQRMEQEKRRWQAAWDEQSGRHDEHLDKKLDLLSHNFKIYEDPESPAGERVEELEHENEMLRNRIAILERELYSSSPTNAPRSKKNPTPDRNVADAMNYSNLAMGENDLENTMAKMGQLELKPVLPPSSPVATPKSLAGKQPKRLTSRQRDLGPEEYV